MRESRVEIGAAKVLLVTPSLHTSGIVGVAIDDCEMVRKPQLVEALLIERRLWCGTPRCCAADTIYRLPW